jgi:hypothetical protein
MNHIQTMHHACCCLRTLLQREAYLFDIYTATKTNDSDINAVGALIEPK